jgi:hypothetical protein
MLARKLGSMDLILISKRLFGTKAAKVHEMLAKRQHVVIGILRDSYLGLWLKRRNNS